MKPVSEERHLHKDYGELHPEDPEIKGFDFSNQTIRRGFIRKVYSILMVQLTITLVFIAVLCYHSGLKKWASESLGLLIFASITMLVCIIVMSCCGEVRRKSPYNFIFLFVFTIAESFLLGVCAGRYQPDVVLMAVGVTALICLSLTLFAFQTKWDFTMMGGVLLVFVVCLLIFGIFVIFFPSRTLQIILSALFVFGFSVFLVYDTQMMIGGTHKYSISPEEYVFAALNLYLDIIEIFIHVMKLIRHFQN